MRTFCRSVAPLLVAPLLIGVALAATPADPLARAEAAAATLGKTFRARLSEAMAAGGPPAGIAVCSAEAQAIGAKVAEETGAKVGRSSLRLRNPANAAPDWVAAWLKAQGERKAEGVVGVSRIDQTPAGPKARVIKPIVVEAPCLNCHGAADRIHPDVKAVLAAKYPNDAAVGYAEGDLRGALWAEVPADAAGPETAPTGATQPVPAPAK